VCVGCQKVLRILLHGIVCIFSYPTHRQMRRRQRQVCVGCQKVVCVLLHGDMESYGHSHTLHTRQIMCVGCQKVVCVLLHGIVCAFSHPTYTANNACRMSESLVYSTAWNHMYIPTPYIHSKWCVVGSRQNVCVFLCVCLKRERKKFFRLRKFSPKFDQCLHCRSLSYVHVCVCVCAHTHARAIFA